MISKLKIVVSGIHYPLSMMTYFLRALLRREDVELWTTGPHTGTWIPWNNGMHINPKYVYQPSFPLPQSAIQTHVPFAFVKNQLPWKPDLWLEIDAGWHFLTKPEAGIVTHIQTDPHVLGEHYKSVAERSDMVFCMQTPYMSGAKNERYLPYAFDPTVHYRIEPELEKIYDACLIGLHYDTRSSLISELAKRGMKVHYSIGNVFDEYRTLYNQSKVALSWSSLLDLPTRVFEAMGMGNALVANRVPDMSTHFVENEHYLGFSNLPEAISKVESLIKDEEMRHFIADNGYRSVWAHNRHTWDNRITQILENCKLI